MKRALAIAILLAVTVLQFTTATRAGAQWLDGGRAESQTVMGTGALYYFEDALYYWNEEHHMQKTTDFGATWIDLSDEGLPIGGANPHISHFTGTNGRVFGGLNYGTGNGIVVYSDDKGLTWKADTVGAPPHALGWGGMPAVDRVFAWAGHLLVGWNAPNAVDIQEMDGPFVRNDSLSFYYQPGGLAASGDTLFVSSGRGLVYTTDFGKTWKRPANTGYVGGNMLVADGYRFYLFGPEYQVDPNGIPIGVRIPLTYTDDRGETWRRINIDTLSNRKDNFGNPWSPSAFFARGNLMWYAAPTGFNSRPNIMKSTDLGQTWKSDSDGLHASYFDGIVSFEYTPDGSLWAVPGLYNIYRQKIDAGTGGGNAVTLAPTLIAPANAATIAQTAASFRWTNVANATRYELDLSTDPTFASHDYHNSALTDSSVTISTLTNGNTYYWRVRGTTADAVGPWSDVSSFGVQTLGVSNDREVTMTIAPNPAREALTIDGLATGSIELRDLLGRRILLQSIDGPTTLNVATLPRGIYWLIYRNATGSMESKPIQLR